MVEIRIAILTSGGGATAFDRILGSRFGTAAVKTLHGGGSGVMVGLDGDHISPVALEEAIGRMRPLDPEMYRMAGALSELPK